MADATKDPNKSYGWTGSILRVNLTTGEITTQSTDPYKDYIGGMGLANKIIYDEVPAARIRWRPNPRSCSPWDR